MLVLTKDLPSVSRWPVSRPVDLDFRLVDGKPIVHIWYGAAKREAQLRDHGDYTYVTSEKRKTEYLVGINYLSLVETLTECSAKTHGIVVSLDGYSCRVMYHDSDDKLVYKMDACCCVRLDRA